MPNNIWLAATDERPKQAQKNQPKTYYPVDLMADFFIKR
jgi:hypothetical protein